MEKEQSTNRDHLDDLGFLTEKLRTFGEYLIAMDEDEVIGGKLNQYEVGEILFNISVKLKSALEEMWEIRKAAQA